MAAPEQLRAAVEDAPPAVATPVPPAVVTDAVAFYVTQTTAGGHFGGPYQDEAPL